MALDVQGAVADTGAPAPLRHRDDGRTRALRSPPGEIAWELWLREPLPGLRGLVAGIWGGDGDASYACHRSLPNGELWVMFNLGAPQRVIERGGRSCDELHRAAFVCGFQDRPLAFESVVKHPRAVCVRFLPRGAWAFFGGLPLSEIANRVDDLEPVLGRVAGVERLRGRMAEAADLGAALDLLEAWIVRRLLGGPPAHPAMRAAVRELHARGGDVRIAALARELGVSTRYLNALFQRQVGMPAKGLARLVRFERAQERLAAHGAHDLPGVADACGYYDQSHLNHDFRELAGMTPTEYAARVFQVPGWRELRG